LIYVRKTNLTSDSIAETVATRDTNVIKNNMSEDTFDIKLPLKPEYEITISNTTKSFKINEFVFKVNWKDSLFYIENNRVFMPGIKKLTILKNKKIIQVFDSIPDEDNIGEIRFTAYDYNFDGHVDFTLPLGFCGRGCYFKYYLFNANNNKFEYAPDWDYVRFQEVNPSTKFVRTVVSSSCCGADYLIYKVDKKGLIKIKELHSGN
jgi:hypothetical protein